MHDKIHLSTKDHHEKLIVSHALAQSQFLSIHESQQRNSFSHLKLGREDFSMETLFELYGIILVIPNYLWDNEQWEPMYKMTKEYLDIENRIKVFQKRAEVLYESIQDIKRDSHEKKSLSAEKIIIFIIALEIMIDMCIRLYIYNKKRRNIKEQPKVIIDK